MEQQNKYHIIVSEQVAQMLISHAAFLAQVSPEAAERLTAEFEKAADSLALMP
jgi:plasmid stabilization system protein ParE